MEKLWLWCLVDNMQMWVVQLGVKKCVRVTLKVKDGDNLHTQQFQRCS